MELRALLRANWLSLLGLLAPEIFVRGDLYKQLLLYKVYLFLQAICQIYSSVWYVYLLYIGKSLLGH
jgi:hypothetical protein